MLGCIKPTILLILIFIEKCERFRQGIEELKLTFRDTTLPRITVTIGGAIYPEHGEYFSELIEAADEALYRGKRGGRNCFQIADK